MLPGTAERIAQERNWERGILPGKAAQESDCNDVLLFTDLQDTGTERLDAGGDTAQHQVIPSQDSAAAPA